MRILLVISYSFFVIGLANAQTDTLNQKDSVGRKQGYWIYTGEMKKKTDYKALDKVEEGKYLNDKKDGVWRQYYPGEILKSEVIWKNNRPNGNYVTYYENGQFEEKGTIKMTHNVDSFYRYYSNGVLAQRKFFNSQGKTEGWIDYWRTNRELDYKCYTKNGEVVKDSSVYRFTEKINGTNNHNKIQDSILCFCNISNKKYLIKTVEKNGDTTFRYDTTIYEIRLQGTNRYEVFKNGLCRITEYDNLSLKTREYSITDGKLKTLPSNPEKPFCDGYNKYYNMSKQLIFDGEFRACKLFNGKKYIYDKNEILSKIEIYKYGKYMGDVEIPVIEEKD